MRAAAVRGALRRAAHGVGAHHWARERHGASLLICCYHGVRPDDDPERHWLLLPQRTFAEQMRYLAAHYACVPLDEGVALLQAGRLQRPTACVTFDDGYRNNRDVALPVLRALGVPATIFLPTRLIEERGQLWSTALELALVHATRARIDLRDCDGGELDLAGPPQRLAVARTLVAALKLAPGARRRAIVDEAIRQAAPAVPPRRADAFALLDWDAVARLERDEPLLSFGAHTRTHPILSRSSEEEIADEVEGSLADVAARLARPSRVFAYPNGRAEDFDARAGAAVRRAGGVAAVTTIEALNDAATDPLALRRITVGAEDGMASFCLRTSGLAAMLRSTGSPAAAPDAVRA